MDPLKYALMWMVQDVRVNGSAPLSWRFEAAVQWKASRLVQIVKGTLYAQNPGLPGPGAA